MKHWATIIDIIEAGLESKPDKVRAYTELLLEKLEDDSEEEPFVRHTRRALAGEKGVPIFLANKEES